jgi:hypothetical protein
MDISTSVGKPNWFILPDTKIGLEVHITMDQNSPLPNVANEFATSPLVSPVGNGNEWEIRTYIHIIGK